MKILDNPALKDYELDEDERIVYVPLFRDEDGDVHLLIEEDGSSMNVFDNLEQATAFAEKNSGGNDVALQVCLLRENELLFQDKIIKFADPVKH